MAGALTISTLNNDTGVLATQNGMTGIAKAWASVNPTSPSFGSFFNCSSLTRTATGKYTVNFTTAMPNNTYAVATSVVLFNLNSNESYYAPSTSSVSFEIVDGSPLADSNGPSFSFVAFSS